MAGRDQTDLQRMQEFTRMNNEIVTLQRELTQKNVALEEQIAKNKALQDELIETKRAEVLVQVAGAAAHEINQPLTVFMGNVQLILRTKTEDAELVEMCEEMYQAAQEIKEIVIKMSQVRQVSTKPYVGNTSIIDFDNVNQDLNSNI